MSIEVKNVSYTYTANTPFASKALDDVSVTVEKGEFLAIIGQTGSGKSTLAEQMKGLLEPSEGAVLIDGVDINPKGKGKNSEAKKAKQKVGMVFQYPEHQLFAETIFEDIAFGPKNQGKSEEQVAAAVYNAMKFVDLDVETYASRSPFQLSGGQMRRVALAGIIAMEPDYLILDEPSAGLDPGSRDAIFNQLMKVFRERKMGVILITHSMEEAAKYAERIVVMAGGKIRLEGKTEEIFLKDRSILNEAMVDVPESVKLAGELKEGGLTLKAIPLTEEKLVQEILEAKGWSGC